MTLFAITKFVPTMHMVLTNYQAEKSIRHRLLWHWLALIVNCPQVCTDNTASVLSWYRTATSHLINFPSICLWGNIFRSSHFNLAIDSRDYVLYTV